MIYAKLSYNKSTESISLMLKGHAGAADEGYDIVCASASILVYTVAQTIKDMFDEGKLKKAPSINLRKGYAKITCLPSKEFHAEAFHTYIIAQNGFNLLQYNYPQYVDLTPLDVT